MKRHSQYLTMRDGVRLAADLYLPDTYHPGARLPTILEQTRYFRDYDLRWPFSLFVPRKAVGLIPGMVNCGYAWVFVDVRGTGASNGYQVGMYPREQVKDSAEIVDWIVKQPWSNGKVGTFGMSYDAGAAELTLVNRHPAVRAAAPFYMLFDMYSDCAAPGAYCLPGGHACGAPSPSRWIPTRLFPGPLCCGGWR